ncbi:MAG: type IV secretion system DNA-binding domain-containing protein [Candidatus Tectomicrobia bacterium]|nr:type IV secretion system DNA-binding domain-containing protein [Candidatus Tectomicrobia bacterium]
MMTHPWRARMLSAIAAASTGMVLIYHPPGLSYTPFAVLIAWTLTCMARWIALELKWKHAHHNSTAIITSEQAQRAKELFVGRGYRWNRHHTFLIRELARTAGELPDAADERGGSPALQAAGLLDTKEFSIPYTYLSGHTGIQGATRAGKSELLRLMVDQVIRKNEGPVVLIDPKGGAHLCVQAIAAATAMDRPVAVLCPALPKLSTPFNPLSTCRSAVEIANRFRTLFPANSGQYEFFTTNPVFTVQMVAQMQKAINHPWSLREIYHAAMSEKARLKLLIDYIGSLGYSEAVSGWSTGRVPPLLTVQQFVSKRNIDDPIVEEILKLCELTTEEFTKTHRNLSLALSGLIDTDYSYLFDPTDDALSWDRIEKENRVVIVLTSSLLTRAAGNKVGRLVLQDLVGFAGKRYLVRRDANPVPITVFIDELGEVLYADFVQAIAKLGEAGVRFVMAWQSESDITKALGRDDGESLLANIGIRLTLRLNHHPSAEAVSKSLDYCQVPDITDGTSMTTHGAEDQATNAIRRQSYRQVPLVEPGWLKVLPNGQGFAKVRGATYKFDAPLLEQPDEISVHHAGYDKLLLLPPDEREHDDDSVSGPGDPRPDREGAD